MDSVQYEAIFSAMIRLENEINQLQQRIDSGLLDEMSYDLAIHLRNRHQEHWNVFKKMIEERG